MASDDMLVIVYKILRYLYQCMKSGEQPDVRQISNSGGMFEIPYGYWSVIIDEVVSKGLVKGVTVTKTWGGDIVVKMTAPYVTMDGVQYLEENSAMRRVAELLKDVKGSIPFV